MIGAGAVATRLLAGAWFGFDLLWVALLVIPMVIFTLDSASRVGVTSGGRGLIEMIRTDIGAWLAWVVFLPMALVNVVVNMSQMSAMVEGAYGAMGMLPPAGGEATIGPVRRHDRADRGHRGRRGARRLQADGNDHDGAAGRDPGVFHRRRDQGPARLAAPGRRWPRAWCRRFPPICRWSTIPSATRNAFTQIMAIAGQALPPAVLLSYGYLTANSGYTTADVKRSVLEDGHQPRRGVGRVLGGRDRRRRHGAAQRLHRLGPDASRCPPLLADREHSGRRPGAGAGVSGRARVPRAAVLLDGPDRRGVHDADLGVADDDVFLSRHLREELALHRRQHAVQGGVRDVDRRARRWWRRSGSCRRCSRRSLRWSATC